MFERKFLLSVVFLFSILLISVFGQEPKSDRASLPGGMVQPEFNERVLGKLGFSNKEIKGIIKINEETQRVVINARAEIEIYRAQLRKLLLSSNVNMKEVEKLLRESLEWEFKMRLAQIEREVKIRKLVGDRKWAKLVQYLRRLRQKNVELKRANPKRVESTKTITREKQIERLLRELETLLREERASRTQKKR